MSLAETQRRLWRLVTAPAGIAEALREERHPGGAPTPLSSLIKSDRRADATTRLDVYANAYFIRIHGVLGKDYPALAQALGDDEFNDVVTSYLLVHPPTQPSLRVAGASLAGFLAGHAAAAGVRRRAPWAPDLARFEWAMVDAFDAADGRPLSRETVAAQPPERFAELALGLQPGASILRIDWPVDALRTAHAAEEGLIPPAEPAPASILVWRVAERVRYRRLPPVEADALHLLDRGTSFADLCEHLARTGDDATTPAVAAGLLERWLADGVLADAPTDTQPGSS